jgi:DNA (cytosine-5)-methyltransferase 1
VRRDLRRNHPNLVGPVRLLLLRWGGAYIIENVPAAPLLDAVTMCGGAFDSLAAVCEDGVTRHLKRHRTFESNRPLWTRGCRCVAGEKIGVYGNGGGWANRFDPYRAGYKGRKAESSQAMGIDWMTIVQMSQAIPPVYAEFIGRQLFDQFQRQAESHRTLDRTIQRQSATHLTVSPHQTVRRLGRVRDDRTTAGTPAQRVGAG